MSSIARTPVSYSYVFWFESTDGGGMNISEFENWIGAVAWTHPSPGVYDALSSDANGFSYFTTIFFPFQKNHIYPIYDPDTLALYGYFKINHLGNDELQINTFDTLLAPADLDLELHIEARTYVNAAIPV
jgi:hypothetical protein